MLIRVTMLQNVDLFPVCIYSTHGAVLLHPGLISLRAKFLENIGMDRHRFLFIRTTVCTTSHVIDFLVDQ